MAVISHRYFIFIGLREEMKVPLSKFCTKRSKKSHLGTAAAKDDNFKKKVVLAFDQGTIPDNP